MEILSQLAPELNTVFAREHFVSYRDVTTYRPLERGLGREFQFNSYLDQDYWTLVHVARFDDVRILDCGCAG